MNTKTHYVGVIDKDAGSDYGISFPDFPGCVSAGDTIEEAITMGTEALAFHIAGMVEDGDKLPTPTAIEDLSAKNRKGTLAMIPVTLPGKSVRVNVMIDENLLAEIAEVEGNRSRFLSDAARAELVRRQVA